jgi:hypothetical protein
MWHSSDIWERQLTNQEMGSRLSSGNAFYGVQFRIFCVAVCPRNVKIKIYKTTILPVVVYGCETWSLTIREEHRLGVFENRVLRGISASERKYQEAGGNCIKRFITCAPRHVLL